MTEFCKHKACCSMCIYQYKCIHTDICNKFAKCVCALVAKQQPQFLTFQVPLREDWLLKLDFMDFDTRNLSCSVCCSQCPLKKRGFFESKSPMQILLYSADLMSNLLNLSCYSDSLRVFVDFPLIVQLH